MNKQATKLIILLLNLLIIINCINLIKFLQKIFILILEFISVILSYYNVLISLNFDSNG